MILHPGARWPTKLWPPAHWARLAEWLAGEKGFQVVITGSPVDRELAGEIAARTNTPLTNLTGRTSLADLAALYFKS